MTVPVNTIGLFTTKPELLAHVNRSVPEFVEVTVIVVVLGVHASVND